MNNNLSQTNKKLTAWKGGDIKFWNYSVSHKMLTLRVSMEGQQGNLHIYCGDVSQIYSATSWDNINLTISTQTCGSEELFEVSDLKHGYRIICGVVDIQNDVEPLF
jgi:hypothetical protein